MKTQSLRDQLNAAGPDLTVTWDALPAPVLARATDYARSAGGSNPMPEWAETKPQANGELLALILQDLITYGPELAQLIAALIPLFCIAIALTIFSAPAAGAEPIVTISPPGYHTDIASRTHKLGGLHPLRPGAYKSLKASVQNLLPPNAPGAPIATVDLRKSCPPVLDQDGYNCCAGCSGTMGDRLAEIIAGNPDPLSSVADLYDRCNGGIDEGADLPTCVNTMTGAGTAPSSLVPNWQIPIEAAVPGIDAARAANCLAHATFLPDEPSMLAAVEKGTPVYFGIVVTNRFNPDAAGYIGPYGGRAEGGHAVLAIGVSATSTGHAYIVRNSWGESWGLSGNCLLDSSWAQPAIYGAYALAADPRPAPTDKITITPAAPTPGPTKSARLTSPPPAPATGNVVVGQYWQPGTPSGSFLECSLAGSASSSLKLATWKLSDTALATALAKSSTSGAKLQCVLDLTGGSNTTQHSIARQLVASGGTVWSVKLPQKIENNFLTCDGTYTLSGSYYPAPGAAQIGSYVLAVSGTTYAAAAATQFASLVATGTRYTAFASPPADDEYAAEAEPRIQCGILAGQTICPYCPPPTAAPIACLPAPPACTPPTACGPQKLDEVNISGWGVNFIWKGGRYVIASPGTGAGPLVAAGPVRRLLARVRARRAARGH